MKLKHHRREARKISEGVTAKRKQVAGQDRRPLIRYRVEIWREGTEDLPEVRLAHFPMEYAQGQYTKRDILARIAEAVFNWIESRVPDTDRSGWDQTAQQSRLNQLFDTPVTKPSDDDIPF